MLSQTIAVTQRVLRQFSHDRRFIVLSLITPILVIGMLWVFFEAADNPFLDVSGFIPPASAFIVHFLTYILCAIVLVRERTAQTLIRLFVSGYRRGSIIGGYVAAYTILAALQSLIVLLETNYLFELGYQLQTMIMLFLVIWLLAVSSIALGILVSNFARNEGQVLPFIPLTVIPSVFFSGMIVAVERLPDWISWLRVITPMYYANEAIGPIIAGQSNGYVLWLAAYGITVLGLAILTLREQE